MSYQLFHKTSSEINKSITKEYSTSFSYAVRILQKEKREAIYNIYGFVRVADEIVDTFLNHDRHEMIHQFERDFYRDLISGISFNPVLNGFIQAVMKYNIPLELVDAFLKSMKMDLTPKDYNQGMYETYIYGSANVVGLMCLMVFVDGDRKQYEKLKNSAEMLGSAFQKVNFLRDYKDDLNTLSRQYFPNISDEGMTEENKNAIVEDIRKDFAVAYEGIKRLPSDVRLGVYVAYKYYLLLLHKIEKSTTKKILENRIRIPNSRKLIVFADAIVKNKVGLF